MPEARDTITKVQEALSSCQDHHIEPSLPLQFAILDVSGSSHKSVMTWMDHKTQKWESDVQIVEGSPQIAELAAVVRAFEKFKDKPFNLVTDSVYVASIAMRAEHALLKEVSNPNLYHLISTLIHLISHRKQPYDIMHVRSHTNLPDAIAEGNRKADALAMSAETANIPDIFTQAKLSHAFYHQNVPALVKMFRLSKDQARAIVATCLNCQNYQIPSMVWWFQADFGRNPPTGPPSPPPTGSGKKISSERSGKNLFIKQAKHSQHNTR
ncbi:hypothetical protein DUI87_02953 [Hirundo rustica rustica]|uniref:Uncharacterized protein n=1 Tax=Hirundo rustica rustica TaxID=333673 RepID=A0A3M0LAF5_HIRRU|nr:hypothetical protein DUI87_02953 [Hirundo rustica rustica]